MKACKLALAFVLTFPLSSFATHVRTAEIIYKHVSGFTYEATIISYTTASSVQADRDTLTINWGDGTNSPLLRSNGPMVGGVPSGEILPGNYDLKLNTYKGTHTYAGPGDYYISMVDMNRSSSIINLNGGASVNMQIYVESLLRVPANIACVNNSSVSLQPMIFWGKVNTQLKVNAASFDTDGDSLTFELMAPQVARGAQVPNYQYPDEVNPGANNQFELNHKTGEITWYSSKMQGLYSIAIRVSEWRNGQLVGAVNKEVMFLIDDFNDDNPIITGTDLWNKDADSNFYYAINPGDTLTLSFTATPNQGLATVSAHSEIFNLPNAPTFQPILVAGQPATFTWIPDAQSARAAPYLLVFRILPQSQDLLQEDITVLVKVNGNDSYACADVVGILSVEKTESELHVTPNPFSVSANIQLPENPAVQHVILSIYDLAGKLVAKSIQPYHRNLKLNRDSLAEGVYIISVDNLEGKNIGVAKIAVVE